MVEKTFKVVATLRVSATITHKTTKHFDNDRKVRQQVINHIIGVGKPFASFLVDANHKNGMEIHTLLDNGTIEVRNYDSGKIVTQIVAYPLRLEKYFNLLGLRFPEEYQYVLEKSLRNIQMKLNRF